MSSVVVRRLAITPVKAMRLLSVERVELEVAGVRLNRRFFWIDDRDRMVNGKVLGDLQAVVAEYVEQPARRRLSLRFPDGTVVSDELPLRQGPTVVTRFFSRLQEGTLVDGPWSSAVSSLVGRPLRLVEAGEWGAVDRGFEGSASLISRASLARLGGVGGVDGGIDARRFRMLIEIDGVPAHFEDGWLGRRVRVGGAVVEFSGHVGRCLITSRDPDTGTIDLPTLDLIGSYRGGLPTTEPLAFGIYGRVIEPGVVAVGDAVVADSGEAGPLL